MFPSRPMRALCALLYAIALLAPSVGLAAPTRHSFEGAADAAPIAESIPGLRFGVAGGGDWFYGDVRSGKYDAPYPQGAFAVDGSGFAWIGERAGEGRIDFTGGEASFFAAAFSAKESLSIAAYNREGQQLAAQVLRANANTGRLDAVRLEAPAEQGIAYVLISGTRNRWIMDNLETDAPLEDEAADEDDADPALVTVVQQPAPSHGAPADSLIVYSIVATNRGAGAASNAAIRVPFDPAELRVVDVNFSREGAWVSEIVSDSLTIETGRLGGQGDTLTATLRLAVLPDLALGTALGERLALRWDDDGSGGSGRSNLPLLAVAAILDNPAAYALAVAPERGAASSARSFSSPIFAPHEPVGLWYDAPDGRSVAVGTVSADSEGTLSTSFATTDLPPGAYAMIARGHWTGFTATTIFHVEP